MSTTKRWGVFTGCWEERKVTLLPTRLIADRIGTLRFERNDFVERPSQGVFLIALLVVTRSRPGTG